MLAISLAMCMSFLAEDGSPKFPWHLAGIQMLFEKEYEFTEFSIDMYLQTRGDKRANQLFVAPIQSKINSTLFYYGVKNQDNLKANMGKNFSRVIGPGYKFTSFGRMSNDIVRQSRIGYVTTSNHEGLLSGLCSSGMFETGHYTFTLSTTDKGVDINGEEGIWINAEVVDRSRGVIYDVGSIRFPGLKAELSRQVASFVELVYAWDDKKDWWHSSTDRPFFDLVQECTVYLGNVKVDGKELVPDEISFILPHPNRNKCQISMLDPSKCCQLYLIPKELQKTNTVKIIVQNKLQLHGVPEWKSIYKNK